MSIVDSSSSYPPEPLDFMLILTVALPVFAIILVTVALIRSPRVSNTRETVCSNCGAAFKVPFKPTKPTYCRNCWFCQRTRRKVEQIMKKRNGQPFSKKYD